MENTIQIKSGILNSVGRVGLVGAMFAFGTVLVLGFVIYSAFIVFTIRYPTYDAVVVTNIEIGGPAWAVGVEPGDVITHVDGDKLRSRSQLTDMLRATLGHTMTWIIDRDGTTLSVDVRSRNRPAFGQPIVGVLTRNVGEGRGRKAKLMESLPLAYAGAVFVIGALVVGLRKKRTNGSITALTD